MQKIFFGYANITVLQMRISGYLVLILYCLTSGMILMLSGNCVHYSNLHMNIPIH